MTSKLVTVVVLAAFTATSCVVRHTRQYTPASLAAHQKEGSPVVRILLKSGQTIDFGSKEPARLVGGAVVHSKTVKTGGLIKVAHDQDAYVVVTGKGETYRLKSRPANADELTLLAEYPLSEIEMVWTREVDGTLTGLAILGGIVATLGVMAVIVALTKQSCPFLYAYDGAEYALEGELYSGAVFKGIERGDMLKLHHLVPVAGEYRLKLANEADETQNTNQLTLVVVDHPREVEVFAGPDGRVRTVRRPLAPPPAAADFDGRDFTAAVASADGTMWGSNPFDRDPELPANWTAGLVLRFPRPAGASRAKLVVRAGNTVWADMVFARVFGLMGSSWQPWYQRVAADPAVRDKTYRFMSDQGVGLKVQVRTPEGWRDAGFFHPTGPYGIKDDLLELDLAGVPGDTLEVRLRGGTFFWMVDRVAIDYSEDVPVRVRALAPRSAVDRAGTDLRTALTEVDDAYYSMPEPGQEALVRYAAPARVRGLQRSLFVRSRGYYTIHPNGSRPPADLATLLAIRNDPDHFLKYSLLELRKARAAAVAAAPPPGGEAGEEARP